MDRPNSELHGLGKSIYTAEQIEQFHLFQEVAGARTAFLATQTSIAFKNKGPGGQWGLPYSDYQSEQLLDNVGMTFIPLYRFFGPVTVTILLVLFIVGLVRILLTVAIRIVILVRTKGCGPWLLAAAYGALFQLVITPIHWADSVAKDIAGRIDKEIENGAAKEKLNLYPREQLEKVGKSWPEALRSLKEDYRKASNLDDPTAPGQDLELAPLKD